VEKKTSAPERKSDDLIPLSLKGKFWLVSADMGYGHQRAISPIKFLSQNGNILNANKSAEASAKELRIWKDMQGTYEFMSRAGRLPLIGDFITRLLDRILYIPSYYPFKERSKATLQVKYLKSAIKKGLCDGIIKQISDPELPMITSFYSPAIAAEIAGHKIIYCIICDTDLNRVWASEDASKSHIIYFAPGSVSTQRLISYGVPERNILLTGFPLPLELLGDRTLNILRMNLHRRLVNLDPQLKFGNLFNHSVKAFLDKDLINEETTTQKRCITITYAVGGAGAQKEVGIQIMNSLSKEIRENKIKLNLAAGTRSDLIGYFENAIKKNAFTNDQVDIIHGETNDIYFEYFNHSLLNTDILWTKPSELSFYCALGIPVIMTPAIGPQEKCNRRWLREIGAGIKQQNPEYTNQWLLDLLKKGRLAEAAWNGFLKGRKFGTFNIIDFLNTGTFHSSNNPLKR
jgi:hypothetical protein